MKRKYKQSSAFANRTSGIREKPERGRMRPNKFLQPLNEQPICGASLVELEAKLAKISPRSKCPSQHHGKWQQHTHNVSQGHESCPKCLRTWTLKLSGLWAESPYMSALVVTKLAKINNNPK